MCIFIYSYIHKHNPVTSWNGTNYPLVQVQAGADLAKMLGESALLADLGPLLRMKQVGVLTKVLGLLRIILTYKDDMMVHRIYVYLYYVYIYVYIYI